MPRFSDESLERCAELFEANRDVYNHPAWRKLMDGLKVQADAVKETMAMHVLQSEGEIDASLLYEYRGRWQAINFLHDYGTSDERIGKAAKEILEKRTLENAQ